MTMVTVNDAMAGSQRGLSMLEAEFLDEENLAGNRPLPRLPGAAGFEPATSCALVSYRSESAPRSARLFLAQTSQRKRVTG